MLELASLRVNVVTPGLIDTPLLHTAYGAERDTIIKNRAGILSGKRVGTAEEVAQVILMLMTNDYLTGGVVHVDGGIASCNTEMNRGAYQRRVTRKGGKRDALAIHAETAYCICTTTLEHDFKLDHIRQFVGHADPSTM